MKTRSTAVALATIAALAIGVAIARADYPVKDGAGASKTFKSYVASAIHWPAHVVAGLFSGTPTAVTMTNTGALDMTCVAGCTGLAGGATAANQATEISSLSTIAAAAADVTTQSPVKGANSGGTLGPIIQADLTPFLNMTTATTTKIVTGATGKKTYITHARFHAAGTTTAKLVYGTGTNCGTGTTDLTETLDLTASDGEAFGSGLGPVVVAPVTVDVCVLNGQAVNLRVGLAATQF